MEHKTPAEVQQAALDALKAANSFHVVGTAPTINSAELGPFDARIQGFSSDTTTVVSGGHLEFLVADNTLYFKADRKGNEAMGTPSDLLDKVSDKWIKAGDANQAPLPSGYTVDTAVAWLRHDPATLLATVGRDIVNGTPVVVVTTQRGDRLYVADTGTPYLLRIFTVGSGQLDFREFGADFHITAPPDASSGILG